MPTPKVWVPVLQILAERGAAHEQNYIDVSVCEHGVRWQLLSGVRLQSEKYERRSVTKIWRSLVINSLDCPESESNISKTSDFPSPRLFYAKDLAR